MRKHQSRGQRKTPSTHYNEPLPPNGFVALVIFLVILIVGCTWLHWIAGLAAAMVGGTYAACELCTLVEARRETGR